MHFHFNNLLLVDFSRYCRSVRHWMMVNFTNVVTFRSQPRKPCRLSTSSSLPNMLARLFRSSGVTGGCQGVQ